jgi:carbon-monoxide dehydrogenase large subunit
MRRGTPNACGDDRSVVLLPGRAKGCGEAGAIGAPAAVVSAALDALAPLGITDLDMPLTSEQVWQRIRQAQQQSRRERRPR